MLRRPGRDELQQLADELGLRASDADLATYARFVDETLKGCDLLDDLDDERPPVLYAERSFRRPLAAENRHGGWYVKCDVRGEPRGPLAGKRVALKDNICLAGIPMMNGASVL